MCKIVNLKVKEEIERLEKQVQDLYLDDDMPWIVGYSGGKDSTAEDCYKYELCHNKHLVNKMYEQRNQHLTSEEMYDDMYKKYQFAILKTVNLTAGIVGSLVFIYYYNK